jgi:beta-N-acetylhexosaminidase
VSRRLLLPVCALVATMLAGCGTTQVSGSAMAAPTTRPAPSAPTSAPPTSTPAPTSAAPSVTPVPTTTASACVQKAMGALSPQARVGQLFLLGVSATGLTSADTAALKAASPPGGVFLTGRQKGGVAKTGAVVGGMRKAADRNGVAPYVAVDQEGGQIQVLSGPGFDPIPTATVQGGWPAAKLQAAATEWGQQLKQAGVNVDLAPVSDVVPASLGAANIPIGKYQREYGNDPDTVAAHVPAFVRGMTAAGVVSTVKHFPGLGRVRGDTDFDAGVTDTQTTTTDADLAPFKAGVSAGAGWLMISSAVYTKIDPNRPAAFSPTVVTSMVRGQLGFTGVVVSDEIGNATQVAAIPPGTRAVDFLAAGGDVVLTADDATLPTMTKAVLAQVAQDPQFGTVVSIAETRVLTEKAAMGLLPC